ncbi:hypothetical protein DB895_12695 [Flavobacterium psychrotolerans]|uniref:Uncharacterized protein n=1 Tax=Flavobacterium psychrotolerans TaxID=2169410 RepID=A0A2U1JGI6_9FLAO|nr:hypothetical protein DB895_12695 [Flavobacterium psychrotolerans]
MKKNIALFVPLILITLVSGIIMTNVLNGKIGNLEYWRIISSIIGFFTFLLFSFFIGFKLMKTIPK